MSDGPPEGYFNVHKNVELREQHGRDKFVSPTDPLASIHKMVVSFEHQTSGQSVFFKAFIASLNETYSCDWAEETIYGRNDPTRLFKSTSRKISMGLKVPAETFGEAYDNLGRVSRLEQFLYPNYTAVGSGHTVSQGPYIRMKVMNLIARAGSETKGDRSGVASSTGYSSYMSSADPKEGLLGAITSLTVDHNLETLEVTTFAKDKNTVLPGMIKLNVDFSVIHEKMLGWNQDGDKFSFHDGVFPYGVTLMSDDDAEKALKALRKEVTEAQKAGTDEEVALSKTEQQRMDATARYSKSMPGSVNRLKSDLKYMAKLNEKLKAAGVAPGDLENAPWSGALTAEELADYAYLRSAVGGVIGADAYAVEGPLEAAATLLEDFYES